MTTWTRTPGQFRQDAHDRQLDADLNVRGEVVAGNSDLDRYQTWLGRVLVAPGIRKLSIGQINQRTHCFISLLTRRSIFVSVTVVTEAAVAHPLDEMLCV